MASQLCPHVLWFWVCTVPFSTDANCQVQGTPSLCPGDFLPCDFGHIFRQVIVIFSPSISRYCVEEAFQVLWLPTSQKKDLRRIGQPFSFVIATTSTTYTIFFLPSEPRKQNISTCLRFTVAFPENLLLFPCVSLDLLLFLLCEPGFVTVSPA